MCPVIPVYPVKPVGPVVPVSPVIPLLRKPNQILFIVSGESRKLMYAL